MGSVRITGPLSGRAGSASPIGRGASPGSPSPPLIGCPGETDPPPVPGKEKKKSRPEASINQRGVRGGTEREKRKSGWKDGEPRRAAERV